MTTEIKKFTRQDYLDSKCTHSEYYGQFVGSYTKSLIVSVFGVDKIKELFKEDANLNNVPLYKWDLLAGRFDSPVQKMRDLGDYPTLAGKVCILKESARQIATQ